MVDKLTWSEVLDLRERVSVRQPILRRSDAREKKKYGNTKVVTPDGLRFDSKAEHKRWSYLAMLARAGEIRDLRMQVAFELIPAQVSPSGKKVRPTVYLADFVYTDAKGRQVVEDVKGAVTPEFRLKRKLLLWIHGIEIKEVRC